MTQPTPAGSAAEPALSVGQLARLTSTSTSAINYYVRTGLLPAPRKTSRTRALYPAEFVERIARIKDLQQRGLPLRVIKSVLNSDDPAAELGIAPDRARQRSVGTVTVDELIEESGLALASYRRLVGDKLLRAASDTGEGVPSHDRRDVVAARAFARLLELGVPYDLLARHTEYEPLARAEAHFLAEHVTAAKNSRGATGAIGSSFDAVRRYLRLRKFEAEFPKLAQGDRG